MQHAAPGEGAGDEGPGPRRHLRQPADRGHLVRGEEDDHHDDHDDSDNDIGRCVPLPLPGQDSQGHRG